MIRTFIGITRIIGRYYRIRIQIYAQSNAGEYRVAADCIIKGCRRNLNTDTVERDNILIRRLIAPNNIVA